LLRVKPIAVIRRSDRGTVKAASKRPGVQTNIPLRPPGLIAVL
jgi:hypothetical protein